jgi:hypothetical protein
VQWSTPRQSVFCAIPHTSAWPAILQTPAPEERAEPHRPKAAFLYTGASGGGNASAAALSAGLLPPPSLTPPTIMAAQRYLEGFGDSLGGQDTAAVPGVGDTPVCACVRACKGPGAVRGQQRCALASHVFLCQLHV